MEGHIFSALSTYDNEMTVVEKGDVATACYIRGLSDEARQEELDEVLSVTPQDIRNLAPYIRDLLANSKLVVCGSEEMIRDNEELFENFEYLS